jgi:hypothetical protein
MEEQRMVKVWVYTEADTGKGESDQSSKYATDEFITRNKCRRIEGSEIEVGENEIDSEGRYAPRT